MDKLHQSRHITHGMLLWNRQTQKDQISCLKYGSWPSLAFFPVPPHQLHSKVLQQTIYIQFVLSMAFRRLKGHDPGAEFKQSGFRVVCLFAWKYKSLVQRSLLKQSHSRQANLGVCICPASLTNYVCCGLKGQLYDIPIVV